MPREVSELFVAHSSCAGVPAFSASSLRPAIYSRDGFVDYVVIEDVMMRGGKITDNSFDLA